MRTCLTCGADLSGLHASRRYCRVECRNAAPDRYAYKKTLTCADCHEPMWSGTGSRLQGEARCRPCRRMRSSSTMAPCVDCGGKAQGVRCRACYSKTRIVRAPDDQYFKRAQRDAAAPGLTIGQRRNLLAAWLRADACCAYCPARADTIDHVIPLVRGGTNHVGNLVPACRRCNSSKSSRTIMEWRLGRLTPRMRSPLAA